MNDNQIADQEFKKYIKRLVNINRKRNVAVRGLINGVFTAIGATLGFAIVLVISAQVLSSLRQVSIFDQFLSETKLDVLIESQLKQIQQQELEQDENNSPDNTDNQPDNEDNADQSYYLSYENKALDLTFNYPASLTDFSEYDLESTSGEDSSILSFEGFGILKSITVYINPDSIDLVGNSLSFDTESTLENKSKVLVYEKGAVVNGDDIKDPVLYFKFTKGTNDFYMIAKADSSTPKIAREIFITVAESVR